MQLRSKLIATPSAALCKDLATYFDHEFELIPPSLTPDSTRTAALVASWLKTDPAEARGAEVIFAYNISLELADILHVLAASPTQWKHSLAKYNIKTGAVVSEEEAVLEGDIPAYLGVVELCSEEGGLKRICLLPPFS
jgi:hypothetical protein